MVKGMVFVALLIFWPSHTLVASNIPGIAVHMSSKGLEYLKSLAVDVVPKIFDNIQLKNYASDSYNISELTITKIGTPKIDAKFGQNQGLIAHAKVDSANLTGKYRFSKWFINVNGRLVAEVKDFAVDGLFSFVVGRNGAPKFKIHHCKISLGHTNLAFYGGGAANYLLNTFKSLIGKYLGSALGDIICNTLERAANYESSPDENKEPLLCAEDQSRMSNVGNRVPFPIRAFTINMSFTEDAAFYDGRAKLGFNGTILYKDHLSRRSWVAAPPQKYRPVGTKMLRIAVSSMVPNSFFSHVFAYSLGNVNQMMTLNDLPQILRRPVGLVCQHCTVRLEAGLSRPPIMLIRFGRKGVRVNIYGWVRTYVTGFGRKLEVFWADTLIRAKAYPYVSRDRMHASTMIDNIYVNVNKRSGLLGKIFGIFLRDATSSVNQFVPLHLSKPVDKALKRIFGPAGGIPLPQACGIQFVNSRLFHVNNAVIVDADMRYDTRRLVKQFRKLISQKY